MAKATKTSKAVSNLDGVNAQLRASFEGVVNLEAEIKVYELALSMLESKAISVRGLKATIEAAQEKGDLPTIKPSTAQYFLDSAKVRALAGGSAQPLKTVLNATVQGKRMFKKEFDKMVESSKSFADFVNATPKQGEKAKAKRKAVTADSIMAQYVKDIKALKNIAPTDEKIFREFLAIVDSQRKAIIKNSNHPSAKAA